MANKKKVEAREKARQKQKTEKTIMYAGIAIVVLVIIGLAWLLWPESAPEETAATAESTDLFSSVSGPYNAYPPMTIDPNKEYLATFKLARGGEFVVQLFADQAPKTVNNFVFLAREGYYDGTTFHRVLEGFMAQGGDPTGTGRGGPGYEFEDEFSNDLTFDREGLLAMANSGPNTNGSQFFITFAPTPHLTGRHTIFGEVVEGMEVVKSITLRNPDSFPDFPGDAIESITISER